MHYLKETFYKIKGKTLEAAHSPPGVCEATMNLNESSTTVFRSVFGQK